MASVKVLKSDRDELKSIIGKYNKEALEWIDNNLKGDEKRNFLNVIYRIKDIAERNDENPIDIISNSNLIENTQKYMSFGSKTTREKYKVVFKNYERIYDAYCKRKTNKMRQIMDENPELADGTSIKTFIRKADGDIEEGARLFKEFHKNKRQTTRIDYYIENGYSEEEARLLLRERQQTFSLEKCIARHGEKEGTRIWKERQIKWQSTLGMKSNKELLLINLKKSNIFPENACALLGIPYESDKTYTDEFLLENIPDEIFEQLIRKNLTEFEVYSKLVRNKTESTYRIYKTLIDPENKRSNEYHLDHKYSVKFGFINGIEPEIIAHACNLVVIKSDENIRKGANCSIAIEQLLEEIGAFKQ